MDISPIVLFVYNRPWHTRQTIEALKNNELADQSDLVIFSDAEKDSDDVRKVKEVRSYIRGVAGFKSIRIIEREGNWGLAKSIIQGVTEVVNQYGKVIVLEDDIVTSPAFLQFMNQSLDFYKEEKKVWHVSGWSYPISPEIVGDAFLWRAMNCWGWATWADRWQYFEKNPVELLQSWSAEQQYRFDLNGTGVFWKQVEANARSKINTWAIFWYATIFRNDGLCLNPLNSYVENVGHDGTGVHCGISNRAPARQLNEKVSLVFPVKLLESTNAVCEIKGYYKRQKKSFPVRVINKITRMILGKNIFS